MLTKLFFLSVFVMAMLPVVILTLMFLKRLTAIKSGTVRMSYFRLYKTGKVEMPDELLAVSRNYSNLFELPVLFFTVSILYFYFDLISVFSVVMAWLFVVSRVVHSIIHLSSNNILHRYKVFFLGTIFVVSLWFNLFIQVMRQ
jgi:hypothetical protein